MSFYHYHHAYNQIFTTKPFQSLSAFLFLFVPLIEKYKIAKKNFENFGFVTVFQYFRRVKGRQTTTTPAFY